MDRDVALQIVTKITAINTALQSIVTGTTPASANRSAPAPEEQQRTAPEADPEEPGAPVEEPETRTKK